MGADNSGVHFSTVTATKSHKSAGYCALSLTETVSFCAGTIDLGTQRVNYTLLAVLFVSIFYASSLIT